MKETEREDSVVFTSSRGRQDMSDTCDYFSFDEDHPTYGHLCRQPATKVA